MASSSSKSAGRVLLPSTNPVPRHYELKFTPDFTNFTFTGESTMNMDCSALTSISSITLHAKELSIHSASLVLISNDNEKRVECTEITMNFKATTCKLVFEEKANVTNLNDCKLVMKFSGFLNDQMAGFYRSKYVDVHGKQKYMASTQFEALDARRAFPCCDEPALKATFGLTLFVPGYFTALSNMPVKSVHTRVDDDSNDGDVVKEFVFMKSPIMSTYLLAFCVGEFDCLQGVTNDTGTAISVYTPPGQSYKGQFALDVGLKCLEFYNSFFEVPYPLPKLDMVAIPEFSAGAMENWGLVTYRTVDLLISPGKASQSQMQRVCVVVCHELAHQWFGNLVTMAWWDDLWLNEGFASYMENYSIYSLFSQFDYIWDEFSSTGALSAALRLDALRSSHPIQVPIHHAEEVEQVFDAISYCKGACVIKMIAAVLGEKSFRHGLKLYMDKHKYKNTETYHLWDCWEEASKGLPIGELMNSWTEQCGFPLLSVVEEEWKENEVKLKLQQTWFLSDGSYDKKNDRKLWCIPVFFLSNSGLLSSVTWIREEFCSVAIPISKTGYIKLNGNHEVPMRVRHTDAMINRMGTSIMNKTMPVADRGGLLLDNYALLKAKMLDSPRELLNLLSFYRNETNPIVWQSISSILVTLQSFMSQISVNVHELFRQFAKKMILPLVDLVGWTPVPGEDHSNLLLRGTMVSLLASFCYDDEKIKNEAKVRFLAFITDANDTAYFPSDIRLSVFKIILKNGGVQEYEKIQAYYYTAVDQAEKKLVLGSLGWTNDRSLKNRTLEWTLSGEGVKTQDFFYPMGSVSGSGNEGTELSWEFFQKNLPRIQTKIGKASSSLMDACIFNCCGGFLSNERADEIESFFKTNPLPKSGRKISQMIENIRANASLLEYLKQYDELNDPQFWKSLLP